uniref:Uncharacterized protein n=1 Tax=Molossus molossus TaxID=27622 RepID=A0A7J8DQG7_MOLMO|nr:hypothetical protein HJG59_009210 [Molossus molossus]
MLCTSLQTRSSLRKLCSRLARETKPQGPILPPEPYRTSQLPNHFLSSVHLCVHLGSVSGMPAGYMARGRSEANLECHRPRTGAQNGGGTSHFSVRRVSSFPAPQPEATARGPWVPREDVAENRTGSQRSLESCSGHAIYVVVCDQWASGVHAQ